MLGAFNPVKLYIDGYDWTGRTNRGRLLVVCVVWFLLQVPLYILPVFGPGARIVEIASWVALSLMVVPGWGHVVRRLNEMRWPGWVALLLLVPGPNVVLMLVLLIKRMGQRRLYEMTFFRTLGYFASFGMALFLLSRTMWTPYGPAFGSMKPAILVGDVSITNRLARSAEAGDVIAFTRTENGPAYISRVIGSGGDEIRMVNGVPEVNGVLFQQEPMADFVEPMLPQGPTGALPRCANGAVGKGADCIKTQFLETNQDGKTYPVVDILPQGPLDNTGIFVVPEDHLFVMGDNRDNSADSRISLAAGGDGFVPQDAVLGRVVRVLYSVGRNGQIWFWDLSLSRMMKAIQ